MGVMVGVMVGICVIVGVNVGEGTVVEVGEGVAVGCSSNNVQAETRNAVREKETKCRPMADGRLLFPAGNAPTYQDLAERYGAVVIPARVRKPRDTAKVEVGIRVVERWILAAATN